MLLQVVHLAQSLMQRGYQDTKLFSFWHVKIGLLLDVNGKIVRFKAIIQLDQALGSDSDQIIHMPCLDNFFR